MSIKDHTKYFSTLSPTIPNTVSRNLPLGERSFSEVVYQSGKPVLDAELNLNQSLADYVNKLFRNLSHASGFVKKEPRYDSFNDYLFDTPANIFYPANSFRLKKMDVMVAGFPLTVEYTETSLVGENLVSLTAPTIYDGTAGTIKRTDFVFLEVWQALVGTSPRATGIVQIDSPLDGTTITIDGTPFTAKAIPVGATDFLIGGTDAITAANLVVVVNANLVTVTAFSDGTAYVTLAANTGGVAGNAILLATSAPAEFILSGPTLTGGEDRLNKPAQDKLYRHGNVQSDTATWLDDDIADPIVVRETAQRIQLQYRIRKTGAAEGVNFKTNPDGFSSAPPQIFAQGSQVAPVATYPFVPANGSSISGNSSAVSYGYVDNGLWVSGDGSSAAALALGSLDGFVYAVPICFVFRKNNVSDPTAAVKGFDPLNNTNGAPAWGHGGYAGVLGAIPAGLSDRPDKNFCDSIVGDDILDLRKYISFSDYDMKAELQYQIQSLMDGSFRTWAIDTASKEMLGNGSGDVSTRHLVCNEVGRLPANGGVAPTSGSTTRGETIRNFDHIARRFGDQPVVERVVFAFYPGDRPTLIAQGGPVAPGEVNEGKFVVKREAVGVPLTTGTWYEGDSLHLDLTKLDATADGFMFDHVVPFTSSGGGLGSIDVASFFPSGTRITDLLRIWHDDGNYAGAIDQTVQPTLVEGVGTNYLVITLDANGSLANSGLVLPTYKLVGSTTGPTEISSSRRIFLEVEITYPLGVGTTDTPDVFLVPDTTVYPSGPVVQNDVTQMPVDMERILNPGFRQGFREVGLEYIASTDGAGGLLSDAIVSQDSSTLIFPRRVWGSPTYLVQVTDLAVVAAKTVDVSLSQFGSSSQLVKLQAPFLSGGGQTLCTIFYYGQDPVPNWGPAGGGYQVSAYFRSNAPQTSGIKEGSILTSGGGVIPPILKIDPLFSPANLWTSQRGAGSTDLGFPYFSPMDQIPVNDNAGDTVEEWYFAATSNISVSDFDASTGLISLHNFVQMDETTQLTFGGLGLGQLPKVDAEFRAFYPFADDQTYRPLIMSQNFSGAVRHKVFYPFLGKIVEEVFSTSGGLLFRKGEVVLVVVSRFGQLDKTNDVRFLDSNNQTCVGVYKTKNLLILR